VAVTLENSFDDWNIASSRGLSINRLITLFLHGPAITKTCPRKRDLSGPKDAGENGSAVRSQRRRGTAGATITTRTR